MKPKRTTDIPQLPIPKRLDAIAEGLGFLAEQAMTLRDDLVLLGDAERRRGYGMLEVTANEEGAKALILLDLVRTGWRDQKVVQRQLQRFGDHLARSIYAEVAVMSPADFREIRQLVDTYRPTHYLDGPSGIDWIFRNELLARREETLYVDYVQDEDGHRWTTPARYDSTHFGVLTTVQDLVVSLDLVGCTSRKGLDVLASAWRGQVLKDDTHWQEIRALNEKVVQRLHDQGLASPEATNEDFYRAVDRWTFPLTGLDLEPIEVSEKDLKAHRERRFHDFDGC